MTSWRSIARLAVATAACGGNSGQVYSAAMTIHRIDQPTALVLEWTVTATAELTPKP